MNKIVGGIRTKGLITYSKIQGPAAGMQLNHTPYSWITHCDVYRLHLRPTLGYGE